MDLFKINVPAELPEVINVSGDILISEITGNVIGLINRITCNCLTIDYMKLNSDSTSSLTKILQSRVREMTLGCDGTLEDFFLLESYDGTHCKKIVLKLRHIGENKTFDNFEHRGT